MTDVVRASWSSRFGFLMACIGSSVGLGNFWRFPYLAGENGGGAWVVVYLLACFGLIMPLMIAEIMIGRRGKLSAIGSTVKVARDEGASPAWGIIGLMGVLGGFLVLSFYSVIGGWVIAYIFEAASGVFVGAPADAVGARFGALLADPYALAFFHFIFMALTVSIVIGGVKEGLESFNAIFMPILFLMLVTLVGYAWLEGDFARGIAFLFTPDFSKLTWNGIMAAIGQGFFSIGVGFGVFITYGSYLNRQTHIPGSAVLIAFSDTMVAVLAGCAIFPIVFINNLDPGSGPGLMFQTLPLALGSMPGGVFITTFFFVLILLAALTSSISLLELVVARTEDDGGAGRGITATFGGLAAWFVGLGTVFSFNMWAKWFPLDGIELLSGKTVFDLIDFLTSNIMLPVGGILIGLFAGWVMGRQTVIDELQIKSMAFYTVLRFVVGVVAPIAIGLVFLFNLGLLQ
jgi:NSS family neurotransmitter:Na+ symporter